MALLAEYDPEWAAEFERESKRLAAALGELALRIEHVGSTSVPGLEAKPVIDIQISVGSLANLNAYRPALEALGYNHLPLPDPPPTEYPFFHRPDRWPTTHHLHLCEQGGEQERRHLAFRDWLRDHPDDRDAYAALKRLLALQVDESDVASVIRYTNSKGEFVRAIEAKALGG